MSFHMKRVPTEKKSRAARCKNANSAYSIDKIADALEVNNMLEEIYQICLHLSSNPASGIITNEADSIDLVTFSAKK